MLLQALFKTRYCARVCVCVCWFSCVPSLLVRFQIPDRIFFRPLRPPPAVYDSPHFTEETLVVRVRSGFVQHRCTLVDPQSEFFASLDKLQKSNALSVVFSSRVFAALGGQIKHVSETICVLLRCCVFSKIWVINDINHGRVRRSRRRTNR